MYFRKLESDDYNRSYLNLLDQLSVTNKENITYHKFKNQIDNLNKDTHIYVLVEKDKILATGTLLIEHKFIHGLSRVGHIEDIVVDKTMRKKGLGKQLINFLEKKALEYNCYKIILNCSEKMKVFYEKFEFNHKNIEMSKYF